MKRWKAFSVWVAGAAVTLTACAFEEFRPCQSVGCGEGDGGEGAEPADAGSGGRGASGGPARGGSAGTNPGPNPSAGSGGEGNEHEGGAGAGWGGSGEGSSGSGGEAGEGAVEPPRCTDESVSPLVDACRVQEQYAVFLAPDGDDAAQGSRVAPVATFAEAIARAAHDGKIVIACSGSYEEEVRITGNEPVTLYGGFDCANAWASDGGGASVVNPVQGVPLTVRDATAKVRIERVDFHAPDGAASGESSVAVLVAGSSDVALRDLVARAGQGQSGAAASQEEQQPASSAQNGAQDTVSAPGGATECSCGNGDKSVGGGGGRQHESNPADGQDGKPAQESEGGGGGVWVDDDSLSWECEGREGASGREGAPAPTLTELGTLSATGWLPAQGEAGGHGRAAQGGGGGSGTWWCHGSGGGCGGCGGNGGGGGQGGGASIALLVHSSRVALGHVRLVTSAAGDGGAGALGQLGQEGGAGAAGGGSCCGGGPGGQGGQGGPGAGGAGGISVGILYSGSAPVLQSVEMVIGAAGLGGTGGAEGVNDGPMGRSAETLAL